MIVLNPPLSTKYTSFVVNIMEQNPENCVNTDQAIINESTAERLRRLELQQTKDTNQASLAWVAMLSMVIITGLLVSPFVPDSRIIALQNILDLYYVAQASVIGMYMGAKAWLARK